MADEITTVDDLVKQHIAQKKESSSEASSEKKEVQVDNKDLPPAKDYSDLFKELNVESLDQLKEKLNPKKEEKKETVDESPEEKEQRENVYKTNLLNYAVEGKYMKPDDYVKLENVKAKADRDLVYENWLGSWKEENPDVTAEDADRIAKEDFETEYKLNSTNEKSKLRGEAKLKKEASEIRTPLENSYNTAKTKFDEERNIRNNFPNYDKAVKGFVNESIPEKFEVYKMKAGEEEVIVDVDLTADDKKEIIENVSKKIQSPGTYSQYTKGEVEALKKIAKEETERFIRDKYRDAGNEKIASKFYERGLKKSPYVGATNPFGLKEDKEAGDLLSRESKEERILKNLEKNK